MVPTLIIFNADPIDAIEKATGERVHLPEGKTLIVKDQTDGSVVYVNVPAEPNLEDLELSEEQLEAVAGGLRIPILNLPDFSNWLSGEDGIPI